MTAEILTLPTPNNPLTPTMSGAGMIIVLEDTSVWIAGDTQLYKAGMMLGPKSMKYPDHAGYLVRQGYAANFPCLGHHAYITRAGLERLLARAGVKTYNPERPEW